MTNNTQNVNFIAKYSNNYLIKTLLKISWVAVLLTPISTITNTLLPFSFTSFITLSVLFVLLRCANFLFLKHHVEIFEKLKEECANFEKHSPIYNQLDYASRSFHKADAYTKFHLLTFIVFASLSAFSLYFVQLPLIQISNIGVVIGFNWLGELSSTPIITIKSYVLGFLASSLLFAVMRFREEYKITKKLYSQLNKLN